MPLPTTDFSILNFNQSLLSLTFKCLIMDMDKFDLLPSSALEHLEVLDLLAVQFEHQYIIKFLETIKTSIKSLKLVEMYSTEIEFSKYQLVLSQLQVLESLNMNLIEYPIDFLNLIPQSLKRISTIILDSSHFEHLKLNPRPNLKLEEICFYLNFLEDFDSLPDSITTITLKLVYSIGGLTTLHKAKLPTSLKEIIVEYYPDEDEANADNGEEERWSDDDEDDEYRIEKLDVEIVKRSITKNLKALGITFTVWNR